MSRLRTLARAGVALALALVAGTSPLSSQTSRVGGPTTDSLATAGSSSSSAVSHGSTRPTETLNGGGRTELWLGAIFVGSFAAIQVDGLDQLDKAIAPDVEGRGHIYRRIPRTLGRFEVATGLAGATYLVGRAIGSETTSRVGVRGVESILLSSALATALKIGFGRGRPDSGLDEDEFSPFAFDHSRWSFPSGHTATAFSAAATVSRELGETAPWVPYVAYPLAGLVGVSRLLDEKHWLTDVLAGAAVGVFSSHVIDRLHPRSRAARTDAGDRTLRPALLLSAGGELVLGVGLGLPRP